MQDVDAIGLAYTSFTFKERSVKTITHAVLLLALLTLANGAIAFFFRYNFITQDRYGPSLIPIYIIGVGILLGLIGLAMNTRTGRSST